MKAFALNNGKAVAIVYKVGTSTLSRTIIEQEQPDSLDVLLNGTRWGTGNSFEQGYNHRFVKMADAAGKELLFPVRDPVERFRSAVVQLWKGGPLADASVDGLIDAAEAGSNNPHLRPQSWFLGQYSDAASIALYRFPTDFDQLALDAGLTLPLPVVNESETKPTLTSGQQARVEAIYADDIALFGGITEAGQVYVAPAALEARKAELTELARTMRQQVEQGGFEFMGMTLPSDRDSQLMINGAVAAAKDDPTFATIWQVTPTTFVPLDAATIIAMGQAMRDHINAAFTAQANTVAAVQAAASLDELELIVA